MNRKTNQLLESIRDELEEASRPGDLGATNDDEHLQDAMSKFMVDLVDGLTDRYEVTEDDALAFIVGMNEVMRDAGLMPPIPKEDDPEVLRAEWLGAAQANGFATEVMQAADEIAVD